VDPLGAAQVGGLAAVGQLTRSFDFTRICISSPHRKIKIYRSLCRLSFQFQFSNIFILDKLVTLNLKIIFLDKRTKTEFNARDTTTILFKLR
jgi:hypothetical protein